MDPGSLVAKLLGRPLVTEAGPVMQRGPASPAMKLLEHKGPQLPALRPGSEAAAMPGQGVGPTGIPPAMMQQMAGPPSPQGAVGPAAQGMSPLMRRILMAAGIGLPTAVGIGMLDSGMMDNGSTKGMTDAYGETPMVGDVTPGAFDERFGGAKKGGLQQKLAQRKAVPKKGKNVAELANKAFPPSFGADDLQKKKPMGDGFDRPEYSMNTGNR